MRPTAMRPASTPKGRRRSERPSVSSILGLHLEDLTAAVHAGLEVDVMRAAQFAGVLVLDVGRGLQGVGRAALAALHRRGFSFRNGHVRLQIKSAPPGKTGPARQDLDEAPAYTASREVWLASGSLPPRLSQRRRHSA